MVPVVRRICPLLLAMFGWLWSRPRGPSNNARPPLWMRTEKLEEQIAKLTQEREALSAERAEAKKLEAMKVAARTAAQEEFEKQRDSLSLPFQMPSKKGNKRPSEEELPDWNVVDMPPVKRRPVINASSMEDAFKEVALKAPYPKGLYSAPNLTRQVLERSDFKLAKWKALAGKLLDDVPQEKEDLVLAVVSAFAL